MWYRRAQENFEQERQNEWHQIQPDATQSTVSPELWDEINDYSDSTRPFTANHQALMRHYYDMIPQVARIQDPSELDAISPHFRFEPDAKFFAEAHAGLGEGFEYKHGWGNRRTTPHLKIGRQFFPHLHTMDFGQGNPALREHTLHHEMGHILEQKIGTDPLEAFHAQGHYKRRREDGTEESFAGGYGGSTPWANETFAKGFALLISDPETLICDYPRYARYIVEAARKYQMPLPARIEAIVGRLLA